MKSSGRLTTQRYGRTVIEVDRLSKRFGRRTVLDQISFKVRKGETVAILGRSGTGKSVTLKTIVGLMDPSEGRVLVLERDVHRMRESERLRFRRDIGYVFQNAALFDSLTVLENVGFPLFQRGVPEQQIYDTVRKRLDMVGLAHTLQQYPAELSGGMRKRVGLARAIVDLPPIVLYDEPTSGLDPLTTDVINQIILRLRAQLAVTSVVVTHDMGSALTIADRIIMLDQSRIVVDGTPDEVRASDNPWVQNFLEGKALENERIDTKRFALPTGMTPRAPLTTVASAKPAVPPSIRVRRGRDQTTPRLGSRSGAMRAVDPRHRPPTPLPPVTKPPPATDSDDTGEDSGLHPIDWVILTEESGNNDDSGLQAKEPRPAEPDEDRE